MVIDDDPIGRTVLKLLISRHSSLVFLDEADNALSAREKILALRPDTIFLDIHMPDATGIDLLRSLEFRPQVIFVTLSEFHALTAMDFEPVDYIVKPVSAERFTATVTRIETRVYAARSLALFGETSPTLNLKLGAETRVVALSEISALQAEGNYSRVLFRQDAPVLVSVPISRYQDSLPAPPFLRLDRSLIINLKHIVKWRRLSKNHGQLWLAGTNVPLDLGRVAMERLRATAKN